MEGGSVEDEFDGPGASVFYCTSSGYGGLAEEGAELRVEFGLFERSERKVRRSQTE